MVAKKKEANIKEFHLFAGIGGGIYGGELLGHQCCAGVEISEFCQKVLKQRQKDGWMNPFEIYGDLRTRGLSLTSKFKIFRKRSSFPFFRQEKRGEIQPRAKCQTKPLLRKHAANQIVADILHFNKRG